MTDPSLLTRDETSRKYFLFSTRWITGRFISGVLKHLKKTSPGTILDIGCGTGFVTDALQKSAGADIVGCDRDPVRLSFAKKQYGLETVLADITCLPFKPSSFDTVIAMEIIEHIPEKEVALAEIKRVSAKNILITVPNDPVFMVANFLRGKNLMSFGNPPDHINHFNRRTLKAFLSSRFPKTEVSNNAIFWLIAHIDK